MRAVTMPETYLWVASLYKRLAASPLAPRQGVPTLGCTSAIAWGPGSTHGRLLHGRNFDYQGVGVWDREQAVVFHTPEQGQRYVSITAAGILFGGITAMNAAGLSLAVHQHIACTDFDLRGLPIGVAGDEVMRFAQTLDDARRLLDGHQPNGAWTYVVTSAREKRVLIYEVTSRRRAWYEPKDGVYGYTNIYLDQDLARTEVDFYPGYWRNNTRRFRLANERLRAGFGSIDGDAIAAILGQHDDACRLTGCISSLNTVASVVFDAERQLVYVATGRPPVSNREYLAFDLAGETARPDLPRLVGGTRGDRGAIDAFDAYRDAFLAHFNDRDLAAARGHLARARALAPGQSAYAAVDGLLALEARDLPSARTALDDAVRIGHTVPERIAQYHLWRGRARDALGERQAAEDDYRLALAGDPAVRRAAERGLDRRWKLAPPAIEWTFGDVLSP
jgi:hypothetical protein